MIRTFKPADFAEQTAFVARYCRACPRQLGCTILADARPLDTDDADYPPELVYDDVGRPSCTAYAAAVDLDDALPPVTAGPVPPEPAAAAPAPRAKRQKPVTIHADRAVTGITITTRTGRDGTALSSTVRLQLAGGAR